MASLSCAPRGISTPHIITCLSSLQEEEAAGHRASPIPDPAALTGILLTWISLKNNSTTQQE